MAPGSEALVDESFLLRVLRDLVDRHILPSQGSPAQAVVDEASREAQACEVSDEEGFERRMESLWDLCVDPSTAAFVVEHRGVAVLAGAVERAGAAGRVAEICLGTLANICTHRAVAEALDVAEIADLMSGTLRGLSSSDGLTVLQTLRLSCALLCGPAAKKCAELLGEAAVERYLFSLEHSLRWEVVQHACNALSQGLVLEAKAVEGEPPLAPEAALRPSIAMLLARARLAQLLTARVAELAIAVAGDEVGDFATEGDAEAALLSALCLAESFVTVSECSPPDILALGDSVLMAVARADRPEAVASALELLATLTQGLTPDPAEAPHPAAASSAAEEAAGAHRRLCEKMRHFAASTPGLAEKFALALAEGGEQENASTVTGVALAMLEHAPQEEVADHREDLSGALAAAMEESESDFIEGSAVLGGLSQRFMDWLGGPPGEEVQ